MSLGASVRIAINSPGADAGAVLRDADAAMHRAKVRGRRKIAWLNGELRTEALDRLALQQDLRTELRSDEFFCVHQPEIHFADGRVFAFESLARWQHPERGLISPVGFVPIIEHLGGARGLFEHVLTETLTTQRRWCEELGWTPSVSVNLSARQLEDEQLAESVARALALDGSDPATIWLEVTETALADVSSLKTFESLRAFGIRLAIDDFGTGWSSMARLSGFPWDLLKIDRSFVSPLGAGGRADQVVESMIAMAHALGILVAAEGSRPTNSSVP